MESRVWLWYSFDQRCSYERVEYVSKENHQGELDQSVNPDVSALHCNQRLDLGKKSRGLSFCSSIYYLAKCSVCFAPVPIVDAVTDARRPRTQANGRDKAIAPVPIFPTYVRTDLEINLATSKCNCSRLSRVSVYESYQELLKETKVGEHADDDEHGDFLPYPGKFSKFSHNSEKRNRPGISGKRKTRWNKKRLGGFSRSGMKGSAMPRDCNMDVVLSILLYFLCENRPSQFRFVLKSICSEACLYWLKSLCGTLFGRF